MKWKLGSSKHNGIPGRCIKKGTRAKIADIVIMWPPPSCQCHDVQSHPPRLVTLALLPKAPSRTTCCHVALPSILHVRPNMYIM